MRQAGKAAERFHILILEDATEQVDFSLAQANFMLNFALPNDRLCDPANISVSGDRGNIHHHLQRDFPAARMYVGRNINVNAYVEVLELRVHQGIDAHSADARLERPRRDRNTVTDLQRCLLPVQSANLRVLNQLSAAIGEECLQRSLRNGDLEICGIEVRKTVQIDASVAGRCGGAVRIRGCRARCSHVGLQLYAHRSWWIQAQVPHLVAAHLHDHNFHNHFGLGLINIANQLFR